MKLKYISAVVIFIVLVLFYFTIDPSLVTYLPSCPLYTATGIYCPGCGSQRATHDLLHLDFMGVLQHNVLYFVGLLFLTYHGIVLIANKFLKKPWRSLFYHPKTPVIVLIIIIVFWILRNLPFAPFNWLAPAH